MEIGVNTLTSHQINCLGQAMERTWGRSSYTGAPSPSGSALPYSATGQLEGNVMTVKCVMVVNLYQNGDIRSQLKPYDNELKNLCNEYLKAVKNEYKELSSKVLKTKQASEDESVDMISMTPYSEKRVAYYRKNFQFEVS